MHNKRITQEFKYILNLITIITQMGNNGGLMFKALSSSTRVEMLKILLKEEIHISGLAKKMGISVPVTAKHVKILEENGLVTRRKFGQSHVLKARLDNFYQSLDDLSDVQEVEIEGGRNVLEALKSVRGITIEKVKDREFVTSIDGEEGYFIYEVNGSFPQVSMDKYQLDGDVKVELKKLVPVKKKVFNIKIKKK